MAREVSVFKTYLIRKHSYNLTFDRVQKGYGKETYCDKKKVNERPGTVIQSLKQLG